MKNQRMQILRRAARVGALAFLLVACFCVLAFAVSADVATSAGGVESLSFAERVGVSYDSTAKCWTKTYDGTSEIDPADVKLVVAGQTEENAPVVISADFVAANTFDPQSDAGVARIYVVYEWEGVRLEYTAPARIEKKLLTWGELSLDILFTYDPEKTAYTHTFAAEELADVTVSSLKGVVAGDAEGLSVGAVNPIAVDATEVIEALQSKEALRMYTSCVLSGAAASNYVLEGIEVNVAAAPCKITEVIWGIDGAATEEPFAFSYGDGDAYLITAVGKIGENDYRELIVKVKGADVTLSQADAQTYGAVREAPYVLYAESATPDFFVLDGSFETSVTIARAECVISVSDIVFTQDAEHTPEFYYLPVQNPDNNVPAEVFSRIGKKFTLDGVNFVDAIKEVGVYTVQFFLHPDDAKSYSLTVKESGKDADGVIRVTLLPYRLMAGIEAGSADVIVYNEKGDLGGIGATVSMAQNLPEKLLKRFTVYRGITVSLTGAEETDRFKLLIPVHSDLLSDADSCALTAEDLYLVDGEELKPLKDIYRVTLSADGSHYVVSGVTADAELSLTLLMAPEFRVSFWATAPGVALIVFLVLLFVMALVLLGLYLIRLEKRGINPRLKIDTEGDAPEVVPAQAPEVLGSAEECLKDGLDALAKELEGSVDAETPKEESVDATAESSETLGEVLTEAAAVRLIDDSDERAIEEIEKLTEAMAEEKAKEILESEAPATEAVEADEKLVDGAVAESLQDALESVKGDSDAVETMADAEGAPRLREVVDAIVAETLAATVESGARLGRTEASDAETEDVSEQIRISVDAAIGSNEIKLNEGVDAQTISEAVENAVSTLAPNEWDAVTVLTAKKALTEVLKSRLLK